MAEPGTHSYYCSQGHRLPATSELPIQPGAARVRCPQCDGAVMVVRPPDGREGDSAPHAAVAAPPDAHRQPAAGYVFRVTCGRCRRSYKSSGPLRIGRIVPCPGCGQQFRVEAAGGETPTASPDRPVEVPIPTARMPSRATHSSAAPEVPAAAARPPDETGQCSPTITPQAPPYRPPLPGPPEVAGYTILGELGRGAAGVVYRARHEKLKRIVVLKMLQAGPDAGPQHLARFHAEAEAVARLHHPNIVQIYESGEHDGLPYLALEFVGGGTLKGRLEGTPQPVRAAVQLAEVLARAIHAAHARGLVHRDLKPANILLAPPESTDDGDDAGSDDLAFERFYGVPKVTDFGLAMRLDYDDGWNRGGEIVGTPLYMAPEQAKGRVEQVGPRADIYALGAILYEMLTGQPPFQAESVGDVLQRLASQAPTPPRRLRPGLPRNLEAVCLKCLEKDPRRRYRSALALADDLRRFLNGEPIRARRVGRLERMWNWSVRNSTPASFLLTVTVILAIGLPSLLYLSKALVRGSALEGTEQQALMLLQVWEIYGKSIDNAKLIARTTKGMEENAVADSNFELLFNIRTDGELRGPGGALLPMPATFIKLLGSKLKSGVDRPERRQITTRLRVYSEFPIRFSDYSPPQDEFGKEALAQLAGSNVEEPYARFEGRGDGEVLRYAKAVKMRHSCLRCHNDERLYDKELYDKILNKKPKLNWKEGETRGVLEITRPMGEDYARTRERLGTAYAAVIGVAAVLLVSCRLVLARKRRNEAA